MIPRELSTTLAEIQRSSLLDLHVATPATVQSYDASTQTVTLTMGVIRQLPDDTGLLKEEELPALIDVPVAFPRSTNFALTFPLASGDTGLVVFCDRNIGQWRAKGQPCPAGDAEILGMSGAVFVPGLFPDSGALPNASTSNATLGHRTGAQLQVSSTLVEARPAPGTAAADFVALAAKVKGDFDKIQTRMAAIEAAFAAHMHATAAVGPPVVPTPIPGVIPLPGAAYTASDPKATVLKSS